MKNYNPEDVKIHNFTTTPQSSEAKHILQKLKDDFQHNPESMNYFYDLYSRIYCNGETMHDNKYIIGTMCVQVPDQLIYAAGAVPFRLCNGFYADDQHGAEFMPAKSCSLVKATLGMLNKKSTISFIDKIKDIISPTTCDQKKKSSSIIKDMGYHVYDMELPPVKESEEGRLYWQRSVRKLAISLQDITGKSITKKSLRQAISMVASAQEAYRGLYNIRKSMSPVIMGKDAFLVTNAYFFDDITSWTNAVNKLNEELKQRQTENVTVTNKRAPRILYTGSPAIFPNLKLPILIEESGGIVVADETCSSNRMLYDMLAVDEWNMNDMIDGIADVHLKPCTCPIFSNNDDRKRILLRMCEEYDVDGVVYQAFSGCQVYEMEQSSITKELNANNIPVLFIESDYSPDDMGQLSTRVEAFIESLKAKKRRKA